MPQTIPRTHDKNMPIDALIALVDSGDWDAKAIYASRIYYGNGFEQDAATGRTLIHEASDAGSARAAAELSMLYCFGD